MSLASIRLMLSLHNVFPVNATDWQRRFHGVCWKGACASHFAQVCCIQFLNEIGVLRRQASAASYLFVSKSCLLVHRRTLAVRTGWRAS